MAAAAAAAVMVVTEAVVAMEEAVIEVGVDSSHQKLFGRS